MATTKLKSMTLQGVKSFIGDLLAGKESLDIAFGMFRRMFGGSAGKSTSPPSGGSASGTEIIRENAAQEGELYGLLAWLRTLWVDDKTRALDYRPKPSEAHVFPKIVAALAPGATKRFMQTIAVEVVSVKTKKTTGFTEVRDPKNPSNVKKTPILSEWEEKLNVKGEQIANALTWLVSVGQGTEDERIKEVAAALQSLSILNNPEDTTKAAYEAAKDKFRKFGEKVKTIYGENDTMIHLGTAKYLLRDYKIGEGREARPAYDVLMESPEAVEWNRLIEAAPTPEKMRDRQEGFQKWLQVKVLAIRKCEGALRDQERQRNPRGLTDEELNRIKWRVIYFVGGLAFIAVLAIGGFQVLMK